MKRLFVIVSAFTFTAFLSLSATAEAKNQNSDMPSLLKSNSGGITVIKNTDSNPTANTGAYSLHSTLPGNPNSTTVYYLRSGKTVIETPNKTIVIGKGLCPELRQKIIQGVASVVLPNAKTVNSNSPLATQMTISSKNGFYGGPPVKMQSANK